jgi:hypothetical protein
MDYSPNVAFCLASRRLTMIRKASYVIGILAVLLSTDAMGAQVASPRASKSASVAFRPDTADVAVRVWVNKASGVYHCPGTRYYGATKRGAYMSELEAKQSGNRPAYGRTCGLDDTAVAQFADISSSNRGTGNQSHKSSTSTAKVWVNQASHVYHCPGTRYYGSTKRGQLMTETEAVSAGNRPAYGRTCG